MIQDEVIKKVYEINSFFKNLINNDNDINKKKYSYYHKIFNQIISELHEEIRKYKLFLGDTGIEKMNRKIGDLLCSTEIKCDKCPLKFVYCCSYINLTLYKNLDKNCKEFKIPKTVADEMKKLLDLPAFKLETSKYLGK